MAVRVFLLFLTLAGVAQARWKPPLMPPRLVDSDTPAVTVEASETSSRPSPIRLGIQLGGVGYAKSTSTPFHLGEAFVGGRLFSRLPLGGRFYLIPSLGYYRMFTPQSLTSGPENILELGANLQFALFKIGPAGFLVGVTQRAGWRFAASSSAARGYGFYRLGPGLGLNVRLSGSTSLFGTLDMTMPMTKPTTPEWTSHLGVLFAL